MFGRIAGSAVLAAAALTLAACVPQQAADQGPNYQAPLTQVAASANAVCFDATDMRIIRERMTQQVLHTGAIGCKSSDGNRQYYQQYTDFVAKFKTDLLTNGVALQELVARKRLNMDVVVTEMANRTANHANDPGFCTRLDGGFRWSMSPKVTALSQVPPPYDFSTDMQMYACPTKS